MHQKLTGYKWQRVASLILLALASLAFVLSHTASLAAFVFPALGAVGVVYGLLYIRTWKPTYRTILLVILVGCIIAFIAGAIIPAQMSVR
jgi:membrane protease YdiL (CAAX protease family)